MSVRPNTIAAQVDLREQKYSQESHQRPNKDFAKTSLAEFFFKNKTLTSTGFHSLRCPKQLSDWRLLWNTFAL
ncbi:hypothetical protein CEXT_359301 [Caerostris extrusa]|uniref:Uncharacterized protein n=1 Tax=Caerostris extrusa TaxID=172846 RepID=A0AAV4XD41_CAEEX|nr:hypothetical protein CEXT_359301 [Caerostris extrusa]